MLVAIGSPDSQEGFSTADEMRTKPEAADSLKVRLPILERRIRATIP
jgi:hypothetical protein